MKKEIIVGAVTNARDKLDNPKFFIKRDDLRLCRAAGEGKAGRGVCWAAGPSGAVLAGPRRQGFA